MGWRPTAIGIDVAADVVRIALVERQGTGAVARRLLKADLPDSTADERHRVLAAVVARELAEQKLKADTNVAGVPVAASVIRRLTVPVKGETKVAEAITFAVEPMIPYAAEEIYADRLTIRETNDGTDVLAFAVRRDAIAPVARAWSRAGVNVEVLAPDLLALVDALPAPRERGRDAVLYLRDGRGFLAVREDQVIVDFRALRGTAGSRALHSEAHLSLMALLDQGTPVSQVLLVGETEDLTTAAERAGVVYEVAELLSPVEVPEAVQAGVGDTGPWAVALGLAAQGVGAGSHTVNYCQGELKSAQSDALMGPLKRVGALAGVALLLYTASLAAQRWALDARRNELRREIQQIVPGANTPESLRARLNERRQASRDLRRFVRPGPATLDVLAACDAALRGVAGTQIQSVRLWEGTRVQIDGRVQDFNAAPQLKAVLESSPVLQDVETTRWVRARDGSTNFTVKALVNLEGSLADVQLPSASAAAGVSPVASTAPSDAPARARDRRPGAIPQLHVPTTAAPLRADPESEPVAPPVASEDQQHAPTALWDRAVEQPTQVAAWPEDA